ncbi:MAG TPA: DUF924 family protein [Pseudomonas sp.]|nr:DUF924 family protein [Pseudomonas sp.]
MQPWQPLLDWWFGAPAAPGEWAARQNPLWFGYQAAQDAEPLGWLAELICLDQLTRMIHRGTPQAFAGDARAQALLEEGLARGWDRQLSDIERVFCYLVLEHAEDPAKQDRAVAAFAELLSRQAEADRVPFQGFLDYAEAHRKVIARFGRFPHRNAILARPGSAAEQAFLTEPGSSF